jgi:3-hydroxybutyryl-CoA dehydrogenase/3-hydroxyacyl-CoA dehydrogenase
MDIRALRAGIVGAGVMGAGIAQSLALAGVGAVICVDVDEPTLARARGTIEDGRFGLAAAVGRGLVPEDRAEQARASLEYTTDRSAISDTDIVVEAVFEDLALKIRLFRELDRDVRTDAILASNTSGFPIAALAAATDRPARVIGWHWASPATVQRMAEIIATPETADETVELVTALAVSCGKNPVVVRDTAMEWGFVANRIFRAASREARLIVSEGICDRSGVDQLMKDCFRWPAGPFELSGGARSNWSEDDPSTRSGDGRSTDGGADA